MNPQYMMQSNYNPNQGYPPGPGGPYLPPPNQMKPNMGPGMPPGNMPPTSQNGPATNPGSVSSPAYGIPPPAAKPPVGPAQYPGPPPASNQNGVPPPRSGNLYTQAQYAPSSLPVAPGTAPRPPPTSTPSQITNQMAGLNLSGPPKPPGPGGFPQQGMPGPPGTGPVNKPGPPGSGPLSSQSPPGTHYYGIPSSGPQNASTLQQQPLPMQGNFGIQQPQPGMGPPSASGQPYPPSKMPPGPPMYSSGASPSPVMSPPQTGYNSGPPPPVNGQYEAHTVGQWTGTPPVNAQVPTSQQPYGSVNGPPPTSQTSYGMPPSNIQNRYPQTVTSAGIPPPSPTGAVPQPAGGRMPPMAQPPAPLQPQQPRRLDPDQMPSPIQVIEDDRKNREGVFCTNTKGQVPPLVTTKFVTEDQGNSNPRFMRSTMYSVPCTPDMMKQTGVPFAVVISPFAKLVPGEYHPPIVDLGEMGPVRCIRCKAYMCPYMQFMDGGRRFQCGFCKGTTEVPPEYFAHLDHTGQRIDKYERPELCLASYEFVATKDYCRNNCFPKPPAFIFLIDVSYNSVRSGMVNLLCQNMKDLLALLPRENPAEHSKIKVGFVTYNNTVHFYNVKNSLAQPQMMVVSDVQDMFMPLLDGFLVDVHEANTVIDSLMEQIPVMFAEARETETILGPAIQAGLEAVKASDSSGKLYVFHSSLPIAEAPGKLKNRDDRKLLATEKEKTILTPQTTFYNQLGQDCVAAGCSVDIFTFPNAYIDIATIGQVCRLTGGQIYKYSYFQADIDGHRFLEDLRCNIQRPIAFDAIMRVRTSTGVRPTDFYGSYYMSNTTDVELASVDSDKAITVEIKHDDKLTEEDAVYIQVAILFTSIGGQRRLRIHNLSLNTSLQMADLYRNCELDTIMNYLAKAALRQLMEQSPKAVRDGAVSRCAQILASYRKNCASPSSVGQLILPECMKLLPLYANCLLKCDAIAGGSELLTDDRSFMMLALSSMDVSSSVGYIYPRLLPLQDLDLNNDSLPVAMRCSFEKLRENGVYLLENGIYMFLWIGMNVPCDWLQNVFGVQSAAQIDIDKTKLLDLDNPLSQRVRGVVQKIQSERQRYMRLTIVRQRDRLEMVFRHFLVEDKGNDNSPSYVDFLCHVHKEIRNLLS